VASTEGTDLVRQGGNVSSLERVGFGGEKVGKGRRSSIPSKGTQPAEDFLSVWFRCRKIGVPADSEGKKGNIIWEEKKRGFGVREAALGLYSEGRHEKISSSAQNGPIGQHRVSTGTRLFLS